MFGIDKRNCFFGSHFIPREPEWKINEEVALWMGFIPKYSSIYGHRPDYGISISGLPTPSRINHNCQLEGIHFGRSARKLLWESPCVQW